MIPLLFNKIEFEDAEKLLRKPDGFTAPAFLAETALREYTFPMLLVKDGTIEENHPTDITFANYVFPNSEFFLPKVAFRRYLFLNCIFLGRIRSDFEPESMVFDNCIFAGKHSWYFGKMPVGRLSFLSCLAHEILINGVKCERIHLYSTRANSLSIGIGQIEHFQVTFSRLRKLRISDCTFHDVEFDPSQLIEYRPTSRKFNREVELKLGLSSDGKFELGTQPRNSHELRKYIVNNQYGQFIDGINFLLRHTFYRESAVAKYRLEYLKSYYMAANWREKLLIWIFGNFVSPLRFIGLMLFSILGFALIYFLNFDSLKIDSLKDEDARTLGLQLVNSLYFSGVTFFTIGYGDILPQGWLKLVAVFEGFTGVVLSSMLSLSFLRRFFL